MTQRLLCIQRRALPGQFVPCRAWAERGLLQALCVVPACGGCVRRPDARLSVRSSGPLVHHRAADGWVGVADHANLPRGRRPSAAGRQERHEDGLHGRVHSAGRAADIAHRVALQPVTLHAAVRPDGLRRPGDRQQRRDSRGRDQRQLRRAAAEREVPRRIFGCRVPGRAPTGPNIRYVAASPASRLLATPGARPAAAPCRPPARPFFQSDYVSTPPSSGAVPAPGAGPGIRHSATAPASSLLATPGARAAAAPCRAIPTAGRSPTSSFHLITSPDAHASEPASPRLSSHVTSRQTNPQHRRCGSSAPRRLCAAQLSTPRRGCQQLGVASEDHILNLHTFPYLLRTVTRPSPQPACQRTTTFDGATGRPLPCACDCERTKD